MRLTKLKLNEILFILLPLSLISGSFVPDLSISLIVLFFLFNFKTKLHSKYFKNLFFYFFFIFNLYLIFISFFSNDLVASLKTSFFYFRFYIFSLAVWFILDNNESILKYFFYILLFSFIILLFDGFFQFIFGFNILGWNIHPGPRVSSFFKDELILGSYLSRLIPLLFGLCLIFYENKKKLFYFLSFFLFSSSEILTFLSGERSAFFYTNLSCVFLIILLSKYNYLRLLSYLVSIIIIVALVFILPTSKERIIDQTISQTGILTEEKVIFSTEHNQIYNTGWRLLKDNIFLGIGPNNFKKECKKYVAEDPKIYRCSSHPHNTYLEIFVETGIVGFLAVIGLFFFLCFYLLKQLISKISKKYSKDFSNFQLCLLLCFFISLFPFIPTGSFFNNYLSIIYFLPTGIFLWSINKNIKK